ncbi:hypothetical protein RO3G_14736 [Rhizopus delemar RA 99-880]|uniref:Uncharacterized protein n=1 Tax=Rhizopus delemar (strain RA 99-880 / ATCC MYA-4621 / FGSC 9543 / NRRL 43880) TaxID=246409 RepID=I1CNJ5_RHIO9|nr:hypothetical protein RO3G_14736 [Rhizopus delemar RA 99-880]|eukprot:EIE90025.1 hypothetical protein RO3G_14736 [Rhizopus delemar RA 99-880]
MVYAFSLAATRCPPSAQAPQILQNKPKQGVGVSFAGNIPYQRYALESDSIIDTGLPND